MARKIELLECLEDLEVTEFKRFKWYLQHIEFIKPIPSIPKSRLENSDLTDTVELMVQTYTHQYMEVARMVLQRMKRKDLLAKLSSTAPKAAGEVAPRDPYNHVVVSGCDVVEVPPKNTLPCDGAENQLIKPTGKQLLCSNCPPPTQSCDTPVVAKPGASEAIMDSSSTNLLFSVSAEETTGREKEGDYPIHPCDAPSMKAQSEDVKISSSSPASLQANLQNMFSSVKEVWWKNHHEESICYIDPELFIVYERGQCEVAASETETSRPVNVIDMFQRLSRRRTSNRTVVTIGSAGIGKSFLVQKFILDWAEKRASQEFHLVLLFDARQLCLWRGERFTLAELIHTVVPGMPSSSITEETLNEIFTDLQKARETGFDRCEYKLLFVIDGLDPDLLELCCTSRIKQSDIRQSTSVEVLLTNLIMGKLLPTAYLWITTQSETANQIPLECVDIVSELRGFSDSQKEEYFRRRFKDERQVSKIISHIMTSRSLFIMCRDPVFCWITAVVLEDLLETREGGELPSTLTQMYAEFLLVQINHSKIRCDPQKCVQGMASLAKLAFQQLLKNEAVFTEEDLGSCGLMVRTTSDGSEWFTEIFKQFPGKMADNHQKTIFCFAQSSMQNFLAAVHVLTSLFSYHKNVMTAENWLHIFNRTSARKVHKTALKRALKTPNGKLDLFLRFIMGLSVQTNLSLLHDLLSPAGRISWSNQKVILYIKRKISKSASPETIILMFQCLNELRDDSVVEEIQQCLRSGSLSIDKLSPAHWSALIFILMSSEKHLKEFNLKKYSAEILPKLMPVLQASSKALLTGCKLSEESIEVLSLVLSSQSCNLRELDLSDSDLQDSGVKLLSVGLQSSNCKLETLRMSGCLITEVGCSFLASALKTNPSHLKELDLSYNHPGDSGTKQLVAGLEDPVWRLKILRLDHCGEHTLQPGIRKYACELELDSNTANRNLRLSSSRRRVELSVSQMYPDHLERFDCWPQVLCKNVLTSRCYWEVKWRGLVDIAVSYRGIDRKGNGIKSLFGGNDKSWTLRCFSNKFAVLHKNKQQRLPVPSCVSNRIAVFVDHPAGVLSFYMVSTDKQIHLYTFNTTFTEPLYAGFGCDLNTSLNFLNIGSSISVCPLLVD